MWLPLAGVGLGLLAVLFVGWEVLERHLFPDLSVGMRHFLLTVRAAIVTAAGSAIVFIVMRRQQQRLSATAGQLTRVLESWQGRTASPVSFENPHLVHCRSVLDCRRVDCPGFDSPHERCWQIVALARADRGNGSHPIEFQRCVGCEVYRRSCPDKLTELGEAFNNLMFLLEAEARQVGRMRAQLVEKEKMVALGQIAAGVAHEVGNPLSSISSIVQMLKRNPSKVLMPEQLDLIETHIQRISGTVRQLVTMSRPGADRWELVDVGRTLEEAVRLISFDRRARKVDIDFEPPSSLPRTYALRGQLQQVFINLSLNALDAMPAGGQLGIRAQKRRGNIVVRVEDTGCGIAPEVGRRVFEPFFTTKDPGRGTGLGLSVSYGIIQTHGGRIDFVSTVGKGTVFTVQLPIVEKEPGA